MKGAAQHVLKMTAQKQRRNSNFSPKGVLHLVHDSLQCSYCFLTEDVKHLIFDCKNVKRIWEVARNVCQINIQWKHIVVGYFLIENRNTQLLNLLISVIAFLIYKIKMKLRFEQKLETDMEIKIYVKNNLLHYYEIYKKLETRLNVKLFHELSICL